MVDKTMEKCSVLAFDKEMEKYLVLVFAKSGKHV